jgi:hypothetical protein
VKKIRSCCWKELHVFREEQQQHMRWLGKEFPELGSRRKSMKMRRSLSDVALSQKR